MGRPKTTAEQQAAEDARIRQSAREQARIDKREQGIVYTREFAREFVALLASARARAKLPPE